MAAKRIKHCPFCGSRALIAHDEFGTPTYAWVFCTGCRAKSRSFSDEEMGDPTASAIEAWNTRARKRRSEE